MRVRFILPAFLLLICASLLFAQSTPPKTVPGFGSSAPERSHTTLADYLKNQFGPGLSLVNGFEVMTGDLDGDGNEDVVMIVEGNNPLTNEAAGGYKVIDPYNAYWGFGDPKITMAFPATDPGKARFVAIVHGWKMEKPVAKFIVVNLPFQTISMGSFKVKKKAVAAIIAEESGGVNSAVFFDGKKYKWEAFGAN